MKSLGWSQAEAGVIGEGNIRHNSSRALGHVPDAFFLYFCVIIYFTFLFFDPRRAWPWDLGR